MTKRKAFERYRDLHWSVSMIASASTFRPASRCVLAVGLFIGLMSRSLLAQGWVEGGALLSWQSSPGNGIGCAACPDDGIGGWVPGMLIAAGRNDTRYVGWRAEFEMAKSLEYQQTFRDHHTEHGIYKDWNVSGLLAVHPFRRGSGRPELLIGLSVVRQTLTIGNAITDQLWPRNTAGLTFGFDIPFHVSSQLALVPYTRAHLINRSFSATTVFGLGSSQMRTGVAVRLLFP
jgi:hypothetical protein